MTAPRWQDLIPGLREYVHRAWMADEPTTINGAARALGAVRDGPAGATAATPVLTAFDKLEADGVAVRDPVLSSRHTRVITAWNWSGLSLEGQSLRTVVECYLRAPERAAASVRVPGDRVRELAPVPPASRHMVLAAIRSVLRARVGEAALGPRGDEGRAALLAACARVPASALRELPDEAKRAAGGALGQRYHAALSAMLRYAAAHDLVALHVRPPQHAHPWAPWADAHGVGRAQRPWLFRLHDALRELRGDCTPAEPDDVPVADANAAVARLASGRGAGRGKRPAAETTSVLVSLGLRGLGPYRQLATESSLVRTGPRHFAPRWVIGTGADDAQTFESTAALLESDGFPPALAAFYRWYARYSMLTLRELQAEWGAGFVRPARRALDAATCRQRHAALRAWLGVAVHELGIAPAECTPHVVFGARFGEVLDAFRRAWERRVDEQDRLRRLGLPVPGQEVTRDSPTVARHVVNAGLIAEALAAWAEWRATRGDPVASPEEIRAWQGAYAAANADVDQRGADGRRGTLRSRKRTKKDVARIMSDVSSLALVERSNRIAMERVRKDPHALATAEEVQRAILGAIVAMGGPRVGELGLLEYARHYRTIEGQAVGRTVTRYLALEGDRRKAGGDHEIPLPEAVVPLALWTWHREHGRRMLMRPWLDQGRPPHDAIFCSPEHGGPFGGLPDYANPDAIARKESVARCEANASGALGKQYEAWRRKQLRDHPSFKLIEGEGRGHHGAHASRNQMTRLLGELGMADRLPYLLGHRPANASQAMYGTSLAETNAETIRRVMDAAPWRAGPSADATAPESINGLRSRTRAERAQAERDAALGRAARELMTQLDELSPSQARRRLEELAARFGAGSSAAVGGTGTGG